ncbi:MAG: RDD family protein [Proteobacteria bacterium]|nr:RDD family protein [Pseudomonadota bacterium]
MRLIFKRVLALVFDVIFLLQLNIILSAIFFYFLFHKFSYPPESYDTFDGSFYKNAMLTFAIVLLIINCLYFSYLDSSKYQGTLGKRLFHLKIQTNDGLRIPFFQANLKLLLFILLFPFSTVHFFIRKGKIFLPDEFTKSCIVPDYTN